MPPYEDHSVSLLCLGYVKGHDSTHVGPGIDVSLIPAGIDVDK